MNLKFFFRKSDYFVLAGIIMGGAILRICGLGSKGLWYDETVSVADSVNSFTVFKCISYKPLYFLFLNAWSIFSLNEAWLRLPSVIFAVLSLFLIYLVGNELKNRKFGLIASFLLAISCFHIYQSQQVRHFTLLTLLSLFSYLYFIRMLKTGKIMSLWLNSICNILLLFIHPYGLLIPVTQNFSMAASKTGKNIIGKKWILAQVFTSFFIAVLFIISNKREMFGNTWWIKKVNLHTILETFQTFCYGGPRYGLDDFRVDFKHPALLFAMLTIYCLFFIAGIFKTRKYSVTDTKALLLQWLFFPLFLIFTVGFFFPVFTIKHAVILLPPFYLIVAMALSDLKGRYLNILFLSLILLLNIYPLKVMYANNYNIDWKSASSYLRSKSANRDIVFVSTESEITPFLFYFSPGRNALKNLDTNRYGKLINGKKNDKFYTRENFIVGIKQNQGQGVDYVKEDFNKKIKNLPVIGVQNNLWFVLSRWSGPEESIYMVEQLKDLFNLEERKCFPGVVVYCFAKKT